MQSDRRPYSYYVTRSRKDAEFVATFLEIPGLSGLASTVHEAVQELNQALEHGARQLPKMNFRRRCLGSQ
jgi:predicted RNase H-like HicB family nuclease